MAESYLYASETSSRGVIVSAIFMERCYGSHHANSKTSGATDWISDLVQSFVLTLASAGRCLATADSSALGN